MPTRALCLSPRAKGWSLALAWSLTGDQFTIGDPAKGEKAPNNIATGILGHHDNVVIREKNSGKHCG